MANEEAVLEEISQRSFFGRMFGYMRLTGPGYLQSAMTLGSGTAAACLVSGWMFGYKLLWVQPASMLLGVIVFAAIAKQTLNNDERPYMAFWNRLSPVMALIWGISALFASVFWNIPQYAIAVSSAADLGNEFGMTGATTTTGRWIIGAAILAFCIPLSWAYSERGTPVRIYEKLIKITVWAMVIAFGWVALSTGVDWGELGKGLFGFHIPDVSTPGIWVLLGGLSAAVGINMVFLYPYSLRQRGWGKNHEGLAQYDLLSGMFLPFSIASILVIIATANTIGPGAEHHTAEMPRSMANLIPVLSGTVGNKASAVILGFGLIAMGVSSITVQMVAAGFTATEMMGLRPGGWPHRICMLLPAPVGIIGSVSLKAMALAIYVSAAMVILLPATYVGFLILNNMKSYLGEAMPRGGRRLLWNVGLVLAISVVTAASALTVYKKFKDRAEKKKAEKTTTLVVPVSPRAM